jgi:hypothetical protein
MMKRRCRLIVILFLSCATLAMAAGPSPIVSEPGYTVTGAVDWKTATLSVQIAHALDPATPSLVRAKGDAETDIDARLPDFLSHALSLVIVDSAHTFGDMLASDASLFARVNDLAVAAPRAEVYLSTDFATLNVRYTIPLFGSGGIATPLLPSVESPLRRRLGDVMTRVYTGLLIYAKGPLPEIGSTRMATVQPALFPRIWDEQMNLVLDKGMCSPASLARWGMVGYAQDLDDPAAAARVGAVPLRLAARAVYGEKGTDLVISADGAHQLLALPQNIALLREGKICVIYDSL